MHAHTPRLSVVPALTTMLVAFAFGGCGGSASNVTSSGDAAVTTSVDDAGSDAAATVATTADASTGDGALDDTGAHDAGVHTADGASEAASDAAKGDASASGCPVLTYESGLTLRTVEDPTLTAAYVALGVTGCAAPKCFIDVEHLVAADGSAETVHSFVSAHFELYELIATEVDPNGTGNVDAANAYSTKVLVDPSLVSHLEALRVDYGAAVNLTSGFRSPAHQRAVCESVCGAPSCTDASGTVTCAANSRHMWGAAADMGLEYETAANAAGFPFVFHEGGGTAPHLHVDMRACE
jgi:hypothetical protein